MSFLLTTPDEANTAVKESYYWDESLVNRYEEPAPQVFIDNPKVKPRALTFTQIICGNCAGQGELPRKTLLTEQGLCADCGGRSYQLASDLEVWRRVALILKSKEGESNNGNSSTNQS
jgi:hypothetical protein